MVNKILLLLFRLCIYLRYSLSLIHFFIRSEIYLSYNSIEFILLTKLRKFLI